MAFEILRNSNFVNVGSYRTGTPEEGEQISTDRQQNQHAVEIQAGCRGSGQGQRWLERAGWKAGDSCEPRTPPHLTPAPQPPGFPANMRTTLQRHQVIWERRFFKAKDLFWRSCSPPQHFYYEHFQTQRKSEIISQWIPVYSFPRFYLLHFMKLALAHVH